MACIAGAADCSIEKIEQFLMDYDQLEESIKCLMFPENMKRKMSFTKCHIRKGKGDYYDTDHI